MLDKHPNARGVDAEILIPQSAMQVQPIVIEEITAETGHKTTRNFNGSGGPSVIDIIIWKDFICSKALGNASLQLCQTIADVAKVLCSEDVQNMKQLCPTFFQCLFNTRMVIANMKAALKVT